MTAGAGNIAPRQLAERQVLAPAQTQRLNHIGHHAQPANRRFAAFALLHLPRQVKYRAGLIGRADGVFQQLNHRSQRLPTLRQIAGRLLHFRQLAGGIGLRGGKFIGLKQRVGVAADVMNHHAATGKGAVHQRLAVARVRCRGLART